ncbi:MAG: riboflavin synthase [Kocuria sp.]|nr:riboflavin synthase [Kocuria sp.]
MFTGIVETTGTVIALEPGPQGQDDDTVRLRIQAGEIVADLAAGASLAVDGVCLTRLALSDVDRTALTDRASSSAPGEFVADVMGETLARTTLGGLLPGDTVNLERCVPVSGRLDGHVVQGHVDATGSIANRVYHGAWETVRVLVPANIAPFLAEKGAIAVDGVSLTVTAVSPPYAQEQWFEVGLIPATLKATGLGAKNIGSSVNVEVDVMAKYAARLAAFQGVQEPGHVVPFVEEMESS